MRGTLKELLTTEEGIRLFKDWSTDPGTKEILNRAEQEVISSMLGSPPSLNQEEDSIRYASSHGKLSVLRMLRNAPEMMTHTPDQSPDYGAAQVLKNRYGVKPVEEIQ